MTMIRRDPRYPTMTPNQLLGEILHQELVDQDVEKSLSLKMNKSLALNASSSEVVEAKPKSSKTKKEDTNEEGSTDEETAFAIRKYKKFLKSKASRKVATKERSLKENAMSVESMDTSLSSVPRTRTRMRKRRNTRRARSTRTSTKGVLTWVNNGTQVMKMRNQRSKAWQPSPWYKSHLHHASSTTSPTMRTTSLLPHGKGEQGTRNYHLILSSLFFIHT
jgi:hypothetical protein